MSSLVELLAELMGRQVRLDKESEEAIFSDLESLYEE